jgi:hypothetical protein
MYSYWLCIDTKKGFQKHKKDKVILTFGPPRLEDGMRPVLLPHAVLCYLLLPPVIPALIETAMAIRHAPFHISVCFGVARYIFQQLIL